MAELPADVISLVERASAPGGTASSGKFYAKDVTGVTQLFYQTGAGAEIQITPLTPAASSISFAQCSDIFNVSSGVSIPASSFGNLFPSGRSTFNALASSTYKWRAQVSVTIASAGSANSPAFQFAGTATFASCNFSWWTQDQANSAVGSGTTSTISATLLTGSIQSSWHCWLEGIFVTSAAGTIIPQLRATSSPNGPGVVAADTYLHVVRLGDSSFLSQGGWS
jgi:hypothetical protein